MDPITIRLSPVMCAELAACAEGSYEDQRQLVSEGKCPERDLAAHAHITALSAGAKGRFIVRTPAEAEDMYYEVCSGVFKAKTPHTYRAACRIANILRPYVLPATVIEWPKPEREPFTGL